MEAGAFLFWNLYLQFFGGYRGISPGKEDPGATPGKTLSSLDVGVGRHYRDFDAAVGGAAL